MNHQKMLCKMMLQSGLTAPMLGEHRSEAIYQNQFWGVTERDQQNRGWRISGGSAVAEPALPPISED